MIGDSYFGDNSHFTSNENIDPIHTILYTQFHPLEGPKLIFEFPPNNLKDNNINFQDIQNYIIPKPQLCKKLLTLVYKDFRLISFPMYLKKPYYFRNMFCFNFVFIFKNDSKTVPYEPIIEKLGKMFQILEEQSQILSMSCKDMIYFKSDEQHENIDEITNENNSSEEKSKYQLIEQKINNNRDSLLDIESLVTKLYLDLNNYSECLIPINSGNSIDIKLFTFLSKSVKTLNSLSLEDVPLLKLDLSSINMFKKLNWDQTLLKMLPYINGVNNIYKISHLANSDLDLVVEVIKNLVYIYKICVIVDIFQFDNIYGVTNRLDSVFLKNPLLLTECQKYIVVDKVNKNSEVLLPSKKIIFQLYNSFKLTIRVKQFYKENYHYIVKNNIDLRKFVVFGCSNNIIYRVMEYPLMRDITLLYGSNLGGFTDEEYKSFDFKTRASKLKALMSNKNSLFSTGDIKLTEKEEYKTMPKENIETLNVELLNNEGLDKLANKVYNNVVLKAQQPKQGYSSTINPRNLLLQSKNKSNNSIMTVNRNNPSFSHRRSSMNTHSQYSSKSSNTKDESTEVDQLIAPKIESLSSIKKTLKKLIICLQNVDNLDRICVILEKNKSYVLDVLAEIGEYDIVNM
ncbi:hypothetical protein ACO0SA_000928 [Hanseniaspora valbyensis]